MLRVEEPSDESEQLPAGAPGANDEYLDPNDDECR